MAASVARSFSRRCPPESCPACFKCFFAAQAMQSGIGRRHPLGRLPQSADQRSAAPARGAPLLGRLPQRHDVQSVYSCTVYRQAPMQVRSRDATGGADFAEQPSGLVYVAGLYVDLRKVAVQGVHAPTMIYDYRVPREIQGLGQNDAAALGSVHRRPGRSGKIHAAVRGSGLAIQDAAAPEISSCGRAIEWHAKRSAPQLLRRHRRKNLPQPLSFLLRSRQLFRIGLYEIRSDLQSLRSELPCPNGNARDALDCIATLDLRGDGQVEFPSRLLQVHTEECASHVQSFWRWRGCTCLPERNFLIIPAGGKFGDWFGTAQLREQPATLAGLRRTQPEFHALPACKGFARRRCRRLALCVPLALPRRGDNRHVESDQTHE